MPADEGKYDTACKNYLGIICSITKNVLILHCYPIIQSFYLKELIPK